VQRALAKDPAVRFSRAGELALALARAWAASPAPSGWPSAEIHNQATQRWQPVAPAAAAVAPPLDSDPPPSGDPIAVDTSHHRSPQPSSPLPRSRSLLPLLGALLAMVLLAGAVLAARGGARPADTTGQGATSAPAQLSTPSKATPPAPNDPFVELRTALVDSRAAGRLGSRGDELLATLDSGRKALAAGDTKAAIQRFTTMQQILLAGTHDGTINAGVMIEIMKRVQSLAKSHDLALPLSIQFD
jgi:hypothetical protein